MNQEDLDRLYLKAEAETITQEEVDSVIAALQDPAQKRNQRGLFEILMRDPQGRYLDAIEPFLSGPDFHLASSLLSKLCLYYNCTLRFLPIILSYMRGAAWDNRENLQSLAIAIAGAYLETYPNSELLEELIELANQSSSPRITETISEALYEALTGENYRRTEDRPKGELLDNQFREQYLLRAKERLPFDRLYDKMKAETITQEEINSLIDALQNRRRDFNRIVLLRILAVDPSQRFIPIMEPFLAGPDPELASFVIRYLCLDCGLTTSYIPALVSYISEVSWDIHQSLQRMALIIARIYLRQNRNYVLLEQLINVASQPTRGRTPPYISKALYEVATGEPYPGPGDDPNRELWDKKFLEKYLARAKERLETELG